MRGQIHFKKSAEVYFYSTYFYWPQETFETGENAGVSIQARKRRKWRKRRGKRRKTGQAEEKGRRKKGKCSEITHFNMSESPQATKFPR